jgi:hypothetical protein
VSYPKWLDRCPAVDYSSMGLHDGNLFYGVYRDATLFRINAACESVAKNKWYPWDVNGVVEVPTATDLYTDTTYGWEYWDDTINVLYSALGYLWIAKGHALYRWSEGGGLEGPWINPDILTFSIQACTPFEDIVLYGGEIYLCSRSGAGSDNVNLYQFVDAVTGIIRVAGTGPAGPYCPPSCHVVVLNPIIRHKLIAFGGYILYGSGWFLKRWSVAGGIEDVHEFASTSDMVVSFADDGAGILYIGTGDSGYSGEPQPKIWAGNAVDPPVLVCAFGPYGGVPLDLLFVAPDALYVAVYSTNTYGGSPYKPPANAFGKQIWSIDLGTATPSQEVQGNGYNWRIRQSSDETIWATENGAGAKVFTENICDLGAPDFEGTPLSGCGPLMVEFVGSFDGPLELTDSDYEWDFGYDDLTWWGRIGLNTFCPLDAFDVILTIDDGCYGASITKEAYIETMSSCPTCVVLQVTEESETSNRGVDTDVLGDTIVCAFATYYSPNGVNFVRSDDRGETWTDLVTFTGPNCRYMGYRPTIKIVDANTIYIAWAEYRTITPRYAIYFAKSLDGGETFGTPVLVTDSGELPCYHNRAIRMAVDSEGRILLSWNYTSLCFASSEDAGATWINKQALASFSSSYEGDIVCDSADRVFVICPSGGGKVSLWVSHDHGTTWSAPYSVVDTGEYYMTARIAARGVGLYAVWLMDFYDVEEDAYFYRVECAHSVDNGVTWSTPVRVDDTPDVSDTVLYFDEGTLEIGFVGSTLVTAWLPNWGYAPPLHVKASQNDGETWGKLLKTCVTWYNYSFGIAFGSNYIAAGWTGTIDTDAWTDFLYMLVCELPASLTCFFVA